MSNSREVLSQEIKTKTAFIAATIILIAVCIAFSYFIRKEAEYVEAKQKEKLKQEAIQMLRDGSIKL